MGKANDTLLDFAIPELQSRYASGELSVREVTEAYLARIEDVDEKTNAYLAVDREGALAQADALDARIKAKENPGILAGVPVAVKDLVCTRGLKTTAASNILKDYVPPYDATVIRKMKEEGAVILGKTNLDAFAHGSSTETSDFGPSHNPHDLERHPGGSSGGSSAAVAAKECAVAIGTETGGSLRQPAALTGTVAIKPTYGRVSRYGVIAMGSSLDCVGSMARNSIDAGILLQAIAGHDKKDATTARQPIANLKHALEGEEHVRGLKIGVPKEGLLGTLRPEVEAPLQEALMELKRQGAIIEEISLPSAKVADAVYAVLCTAEVSSNLMRYDGIHYGASAEVDRPEEIASLKDVYELTRGSSFGLEAKRRVMTGSYALSAGYYDAYYKRAAQVRTKIIREFAAAFQDVDLIVGAAAPDVADKLGKATNDPTYGYTADDPITFASAEAGLPAISLPCGVAKPTDGETPMPVGLQLIAPQFGETTLIKSGLVYERATADADWRAQIANPLT